MNTKSINMCKLTAIVVDHGASFLSLSGSTLDFDVSARVRSGAARPTILDKSLWTCVAEGVIEYARIVYDLLDDGFKISVTCSDTAAKKICTFEDEMQNLQQIIRSFGELGPPKTPSDLCGTSSIYPGVAEGARGLLEEHEPQAAVISEPATRRLIVITTLDSERDTKSISNIVWEIQNEHSRSKSCHLDLLIVNLSNTSEKIAHPMKQVSQHLDMTTVTLKTISASEKIARLARKHYNLQSTIVTGIPMKEEQQAGTSANYDVEIIHSSAAHHEAEWMSSSGGASEEGEHSSKSSLVLKWCTPKSAASHDLHAVVGVHRMTPAEVNSRPAACLIMFLLQGRSVMLEQTRSKQGKVMSHMLTSHGGDVYIHVLTSGRSPMEDPPSLTDGPGGKVTDYRITDFGRLMKENRLAPYPDKKQGTNEKGVTRLKRYSKFWPMTLSESIIFNMQQDLEPLFSHLTKHELTEQEVQQCKQVIYKLQAMESRGDSLNVPIVAIRGKSSKKDEQYRQLWVEIERLLDGVAETSTMHRKIFDCLRGAPTDTTSETKKDVASSEEKAWSELERYQNMTETEKKSYNNKQPSDPRKRKASETPKPVVDGQPSEQGLIAKKSRPQDAKKPERRSSVHHLTPSSLHQPKSSLLSLWTSHLAMTSSRLHDEMEGRRVAGGGKYELYAKKDGAGDQAAIAITGTVSQGKEWV